MKTDGKEDKFEYTYSAPTESERRAIEDIKKQYEPKKQADSDFERLRKLDEKVKRPPAVVSAIVGIVGTLALGLGMTMILEWGIMLWGVVVGVIGLALAAAAYPIYNAIFKRNKKKYADQIIRLSNEILNNGEEK
ncbi:MAG: hypothetical protein K2G37_05580 [Clostridia bacterium]|nr:hypothetical protein [Clostridia bacterium]MDE7329462.1 hypothetical protein [Clostridia bacterium]